MNSRWKLLAFVPFGLLLILGLAWSDGPKGKPDAQYTDDDGPDLNAPSNPLGAKPEPRPDAIEGSIALSDGKTLTGGIYLTRDKSLNLFEPKEKKLYKVVLADLVSIESRVLVERMEPEWRWKENASDEKVFTGKSYPMREFETVLNFKSGKTLVGDCTALIYLANANGEIRFILHKRQKGEVGQKLSDLVYVKSIDLRKPEPKPEK